MRWLSFFVYPLFIIAIVGSPLRSFAQERQMGGVGITVFADQNFRGRSSAFRDDVYDLEPLGLNDKISSLRVARGERWEVCEHSNFQGRCVVVSGSESDLRRNDWNDQISSMRRVRGGGLPRPPSTGGWYIVLFDRTNYRGNPTNYNGPYPDVGGSAQSVTIGSGVWELCEGQNYSGRCVTVDRSVPDLAAYNMRNRVYSVRPVEGGGPQPPPVTNDWYIVLFDQPNFRGNPTTITRRYRISEGTEGALRALLLAKVFGSSAKEGTSVATASCLIRAELISGRCADEFPRCDP